MKTREELIQYLDNKFIHEVKDAKVSIPNDLFRNLSKTKGMKNASQFSFSFNYLVLNSFLTKYASYWDYDSEFLFTKKDMKVALGYSRENKSINHLIKVGGVLEKGSFLTHEADIPAFYGVREDTKVLPSGKGVKSKTWELSYMSDMPRQMVEAFDILKRNGNVRFQAPIPNFLTGADGYHETLNDRYATFTVDYKMLREMLFEENDMSLLDICVFYFFKQIGYSGNEMELTLEQITSQMNISKRSVSTTVDKLHDKGFMKRIDTGYSYKEVEMENGTVANMFTRNPRKYQVLR